MSAHATGFPKHGNHALVKALQLLGCPARVRHIPWAEESAYRDAPRVFIMRDPRDAIISMLRMHRHPVTPGMFLTWFRAWRTDDGPEGVPLALAMAEYEGWLTDPDTLVVRFEDLKADSQALRRIAAHIGVPYLEGAWESLPGLTRTWNDTPSDYRIIWTPEIEAAWNAEGGSALLARWGYV